MGVLGALGEEGRRWLWERQDKKGKGKGKEEDDGDSDSNSDGAGGPGPGKGGPGGGPGGGLGNSKGPGKTANQGAQGTPAGPGGPGVGNGGAKGPGGNPGPPGAPGPPGLQPATSSSTTSTTSQETTTSSSITSTSTTSTEPPATTSITPLPPPPTTSTTPTSSPLVTSNTQPAPSFTAIPVVIAPSSTSSSFTLPSTSSTIVSTSSSSSSSSLLSSSSSSSSSSATSVPFFTTSQSQTLVSPTTTPIIFTPPPKSSSARSNPAQSNGNAQIPHIAPTSMSRSTRISSPSSTPSTLYAGSGISSSNSGRATVIGIGVSIGVILTILGGLLYFVLRRRRKQSTKSMAGRSASTDSSFLGRVSGRLSRAPAALPPKIPVQDFNTYTPVSVLPIQRQFDTSSEESSNVEMPPSALFIPQIIQHEAIPYPPIFTNQAYQQQGQQLARDFMPQSNPQVSGTTSMIQSNDLVPPNYSSTTTTVRTGPLSLSWFLGKPSKIPQPVHGSPAFHQPTTGYGAEKTESSRNIHQFEANLQQQEKRWKQSREIARRSSYLTASNSHNSASTAPEMAKRQTMQSEGWESGIGDAVSARFLSGFGSDTTGHDSIEVQDAKTDFVQSITREDMMVIEQKKQRIADRKRQKWESSPDSLNELPRWRDPVLSIFEEVKENTEVEEMQGPRKLA